MISAAKGGVQGFRARIAHRCTPESTDSRDSGLRGRSVVQAQVQAQEVAVRAHQVRAAAVADFGPFKFGGFLAWMAWLVIHIFFLIGFRNRFLVISQWAWAYLTYERGARLITTAEAGCRTCSEV